VDAYLTWLERKVIAHIQARWGPHRVGPHGLMQPLADGLKFIFKEDPMPANVDKPAYFIAPFVALMLALTSLAVIPFGPQKFTLWGYESSMGIADVSISLLVLFAITALGVYGVALAGWASNNKYSLLGGLRSSAQMISYELALTLSVVGVLLIAGSFSLREIVEQQGTSNLGFLSWNLFGFGNGLGFTQIIGFSCFFIAAIAETNRVPFDLPEAESELVAGYMTEYSGFRWSLYFLAEYANMVIVAGIATTLFLGGWLRPGARYHEQIPGTSIEWLDALPALLTLGVALYCISLVRKQPVKIQKIVMALVAGLCVIIAGVLASALVAPPAVMQGIHGAFWFMAKVFAYIYAFLWIRFTFPRYRFDQLMRLGWRFLIPLALVNVIGVGVAIVLRQQWAWGPIVSLIPTTLGTLGVAMLLAKDDAPVSEAQTADGE
jgi:NADH-quinone oxidoreductase subunit H